LSPCAGKATRRASKAATAGVATCRFVAGILPVFTSLQPAPPRHEPRRRVRLRAATTKTRRALWIELHPALADAVEQRLGPREDRNPDARLFSGSGADALRTSIAKACRASGIPLFSPHDLRHRRVSLMHLRGVPWARIGEFVGQRNLSVTADVYSHVLADETRAGLRGADQVNE
jgi:integrase